MNNVDYVVICVNQGVNKENCWYIRTQALTYLCQQTLQ